MGGAFEWPPLADVVEYRRNVRNVVINLIRDTPLQLPITMESKWVRYRFSHFYQLKVKVKVSHSLLAVGAVGVRVPLYLGHS